MADKYVLGSPEQHEPILIIIANPPQKAFSKLGTQE